LKNGEKKEETCNYEENLTEFDDEKIKNYRGGKPGTKR
jgi:hypothetical protein